MIARLLISPSREKRAEEINKILSPHKKHPDLLYFSKDSKLGIEQTRKIKEHFSLKPYSDKGRTVVLEDASSLTNEAQNALLKTIEELPKDAILILGASSDTKFLPTILSRCEIVRIPDSPNPTSHRTPTSEVGLVIKASLAERFEYIEELKNREEFLLGLVQYFHQDLRLHLKGVNVNFLKELLQAAQWAEQNVNTRAILEYLMLIMPKA